MYVVEGEDRVITDVCSFYCLPSSILHHPQHKELKAAYMCAPPPTVLSLELNILWDAAVSHCIQMGGGHGAPGHKGWTCSNLRASHVDECLTGDGSGRPLRCLGAVGITQPRQRRR